MKYRKFGKLDWKVSALGFGAMCLPVLNGDHAIIDEPESIKMIRYAIDHGVNYIDSAYLYHRGNSEFSSAKPCETGTVKKSGLPPNYRVETCNVEQDFDRLFNEQITRLQTNKVDFYLLHGLNKMEWPKVRDFGVLKWAEARWRRDKSAISDFLFMTITMYSRKLSTLMITGYWRRFNTIIWTNRPRRARQG